MGSPKFRRLLYMHAVLLDPGEAKICCQISVLPSLRHTRSAFSPYHYFSGLYHLKVITPPNGLHTLCLHFTNFVTLFAQDSILGSHNAATQVRLGFIVKPSLTRKRQLRLAYMYTKVYRFLIRLQIICLLQKVSAYLFACANVLQC